MQVRVGMHTTVSSNPAEMRLFPSRTVDRDSAVGIAPSMNAPNVANTIWGLATLGWQAGEGPMRGALEGAAVRSAPSMDAQELANTIWGLDWQVLKLKWGVC